MPSTPSCLACCRRPAARQERSLKYPAEPVLSSVSFSHRLSLWASPRITLSPLYSVERPPVGVTCCVGSANAINKTRWTSNKPCGNPSGYSIPCSEGSICVCFWSVEKKVCFLLKNVSLRSPCVSFLATILRVSEISINDCQLVFDP